MCWVSRVTMVHGNAVDIALPCFWGVTGWGRAVKSESRPAEYNGFIYCISICDSSWHALEKKLFEMELIGRKKISPVKNADPSPILKTETK